MDWYKFTHVFYVPERPRQKRTFLSLHYIFSNNANVIQHYLTTTFCKYLNITNCCVIFIVYTF